MRANITEKKITIRTEYGMYEIKLKRWSGDHGYVVRVAKLPEIVTQGDNIKDAKKMAREAIELCVASATHEHHTNIKSKRRAASFASSRL